MPAITTDIELRYSGGAANTSAAAALGGALSTVAGGTVDDAVKNDLFPDVTPAEQASGNTKYRGIYAQLKAAATGSLTDARIYHSVDSANAGDVLDLGIAVEAVSVAMATIANESTAPTSVTFTHPTTYAGGLNLNSTTGLVAGAYRGVWVRRVITAAATPGPISNSLKVEGTTV